MKIKIIESNEYEDITCGKVYDVVDEYLSHYVVKDDQFVRNAILKEHCEIVTEEKNMFNKGDRVKIVVNSYDGIRLSQEWSLEEKEGMCGEIVDLPKHDNDSYYVQFDDDEPWHVPEKLLQKLPNQTDLEDDDNEDDEKTDPDVTPTLTEIIRFTQNNKGFNVSIEDGNMTIIDWSNDPSATFYRPKTLEELLDLMELIEKINEYKFDGEN